MIKEIQHEAGESTRQDTLKDRCLAYLLLRVAIGTAMTMHGGVRIFLIGPTAYAETVVRQMAHTPLPPLLIRLFGIVLPFGELAVGLVLLAGLWTRLSLAAGVLIMLALIFGSGLSDDWQAISIQLFYAAVFAALLALRQYNIFSWDARNMRRKQMNESSQ